MAFIFEIFMEILLTVVGEIILEGIIGALFGNRPKPGGVPQATLWLALGQILLGATVAGLSLLVWPKALISNFSLQILNLFITPLASGAVSEGIGRLKDHYEKRRLPMDSLLFGTLFGAAFVLTRFLAINYSLA